MTIIHTVGQHWTIYHVNMIQQASVETVFHLPQVSCKLFMKIKRGMSALESIISTGCIKEHIAIFVYVNCCFIPNHFQLLFRKPKKGINYLIETEIIDEGDAESICKFLRDEPGINKQKIGEYLGNLRNPLSMDVLQ